MALLGILGALVGAGAGAAGAVGGAVARGGAAVGSGVAKTGAEVAGGVAKGVSGGQKFSPATGKPLQGGFVDTIKEALGKGEKGALSEFEQRQMKMWDAEETTRKQRDRFTKQSVKHSNTMGAQMNKGMKKMGGAAGMMGISTSMSSLLRQSQLFTGLMGALFQVVGAFIDVLVAPFMPGLFKLVAMLAKGIPWAQKFAKLTFVVLDTLIGKPIMFIMRLIIGWYKIVFKLYGWVWGTLWKGVQWLFGKFGDLMKWLREFDLIKRINNALRAAWNFISNPGEWWSGPLHPLKKMFSVISGIIGFVVDIIKGVWNWLKELPFTIGEFFIGIKTKITEIWNGITGWLGEKFESVWEIIKNAADWIWGTMKTGWTVIENAASWIWGTLSDGWTAVKDSVSAVAANVALAWAWIGEKVKTAWNTLVDTVSSAWTWIGGGFKNAWTTLKDGLSWLWGTFKTAWEGMQTGLTWIGGGFKEAWITLKGWVGDVKDVLVDKVKRVVVWLWTTGKGIFIFYKDLLLKIGGYIIGGFFTIKDLVYKYIVQPLGNMWNWLTTKPWEFIKKAFGMFVDKIKAFFSFDWLKKGFNSVISAIMFLAEKMGDVSIIGYSPFEGMKTIAGALESLKFATPTGHPGGTSGGTTTFNVKIDTGYLGMPQKTSQQIFSDKHTQAKNVLNTIHLQTDVDTSANYSFSWASGME